MQRFTAKNTSPIFSGRLAIVVAIACVAMLASCDFHKRREYKGEAPPPADTTTPPAETSAPTDTARTTEPPAEMPPAETPPETPPATTAAMAMPKGDGCDAVAIKASNLQLEQLGANVPPEQQAQLAMALEQTRTELEKRCTEEKWTDAKRKCVVGADSMNAFRECVLPKPEDHPECAAAAKNFIAVRLAQVPEGQRAQIQAMADDQLLQILDACVNQKWPPAVLQCMTKATSMEELQPCLQLLQPPQP